MKKSQLSQQQQQPSSHNTTTTITRPTGASSNLNESQGHNNGLRDRYDGDLQKFDRQNNNNYIDQTNYSHQNTSNTPNQNVKNKFVSGSRLSYIENMKANETVILPYLKPKLKIKVKKSKKRRALKSPAQKDVQYQQMLNYLLKQKQNLAHNYDFEERQNSRIAKLLNLEQNNLNLLNSPDQLLNYNSDDYNLNNREISNNNSMMQQYQRSGYNSAMSGGYNTASSPQKMDNKNNYSKQQQNIIEREQYLQSIVDQGVKLPIIAPDTQLQQQINSFSNLGQISGLRHRSNTSMNTTQNAATLKRNSMNLASTPGQSNDKTNRTQNYLDTTINSTNRNQIMSHEKDIDQFETFAQITIDSKKQYGTKNNQAQPLPNAYQIYQQNLMNTAINVIDHQNPGSNNFQNASQIYNQKAPNYMKPTQKFMAHIREVSSGKSSNRNYNQNNQMPSQERYNSQLSSQNQVYRQPNFPGQIAKDINDFRRFDQNAPYVGQNTHNIPIYQNNNSKTIRNSKSIVVVDQLSYRAQQQHQYQQNIHYTQEQLDQMQQERESKMKEHHSRVQSIVQKLTSPRRRNRFCPCCQYKVEQIENSPYDETNQDKGKHGHHHHNHHNPKDHTASRNGIHLNDTISRHHDHNLSENNILEHHRSNSGGGHSFLRKGQNKLAHKRVPDGVHLNQYPDVSDTHSHHSTIYPKFQNGQKQPWRYTGNYQGQNSLTPMQKHPHSHYHGHHHNRQNQVGQSNDTFKDSIGARSPKFPSRKMSPEVQDRLLGRANTSKRICSTLHNHTNTPMQRKQATLESIIKPRPMSAEKILKQDISLSPIQFSQQDQDNQVSAGAFSPTVKFNEFETQTGNHLLDNFKWKEERSIEIETDPPVIEKKPDPVVEINMEPIVFPMLITPKVKQERKVKPKINYDWAESEIFKHVQDKHQYQKQISRGGQNQHTQGLNQNINKIKDSNNQQQVDGKQPYNSYNLLQQANLQNSDQQSDHQNHSTPQISINQSNQLVYDNLTQENLIQIEQQALLNTISPQNHEYMSSNRLSQLETDPYRSTLQTFNRLEVQSKETDRQSQQTAQHLVDHHIIDKDVKRFGNNKDQLNQVQIQKQNIQGQSVGNQSMHNQSNMQDGISYQNLQQITIDEQTIEQVNSRAIAQNTINPNEPMSEHLNINSQSMLENDLILTPPVDEINPNNFEIYTEIEATYKASLLKKKARSYNTPETLQEFHTIAKKTIEVLTCNMIQSDISLDRIFEYYDEITRPNVIKMMLRCRLLYQARVDVKQILLQIIRKEEMYQDIKQLMTLGEANLQRLNQQELAKLFSDGLRLIQRLLSSINNFRHEHKIFKSQFIFKNQDYQESLVLERNEIQDFIWNSGLQESINNYQNSQFKNEQVLTAQNSQENLNTKTKQSIKNINNNTADHQNDASLIIQNEVTNQAREILQQNSQLDDLTFRHPTQQIIIHEKQEKSITGMNKSFYKPQLQIDTEQINDEQDDKFVDNRYENQL
eukprot:403360877